MKRFFDSMAPPAGPRRRWRYAARRVIQALGIALALTAATGGSWAATPEAARVVFLIGEDEYKTWETLPEFAASEVSPLGYQVRVLQQDPNDKHRFPGLVEALREADVLVVSVRRRALPKDQLDAIRAHLSSGRPLVGIRTTCHAFAPRGGDIGKGESWEAFDAEVLGGNYHGHHGSGPRAALRAVPGEENHRILEGVDLVGFTSLGSLYKVSPLKPGTHPLLLGSIPGQPEEPVAWLHTFGERSARVFFTSLGHPDDFGHPAFRRLLLNGIQWALGNSGEAARDRADVETGASGGWEMMVVPGTWEDRSQGRLANLDGFAWYRCRVRPPADWEGKEWSLLVDNVDNAHEAYVNGVKVGGAGAFPPQYENGLAAKAEYRIPEILGRAGEWLTVAVRVYDHEGRGGFKGRAPALRAGDRVIALAGDWQFRAGDDASWALLSDDETVGNALFHNVIGLEAFERGAVPERIQVATPPLAPEESARRFQVADGLAMELVLSEPQIAQPLQISFDERGRLWLVEYRQYPAPAGLTLVSHDQFWRAVYDRVPAAPPHHVRGKDRISIHEDTDGDGAYDRHSVFVDGLNIATAVAVGRGGAWVLNPPYLLFYPDRNGDDVPDGDPEVHLEGFGLEDTHSVINSLRWGPDGWLYAAQGSTVSGRVRRPGSTNAPVQTLGQNIWRYHPESRRYEVFAEGGGNAFGVEIDDEGRIFSGHNGGNTRGFHYVQGGYLQKGFEKHGQLSNPYAFGYFPPMAHHDVERFTHTFLVYGGGALSGQFDGRLFGIEPLQGRVVMSEMVRDGATFRTRDVGHAVISEDPWFKPVDIKLGPDGFIYVADWYDFQVNHWRNYQGNMDAGNGRVYRLKARGSAPARLPDLGRIDSGRLVEWLESQNRWARQTALRLLADRRDAGVIDAIQARLFRSDDRRSLDLLWGLHAVGGLTPEVARRALHHQDARVREWTVRLLADAGAMSDSLLNELVEVAAKEADVNVRVQLAASARRLPAAQAMALLRPLLRRDEDAADARQPLMIWWAMEVHAGSSRSEVLGLLSDRADWSRPLVTRHLLERLMRRYAAAGSTEDLETCAQIMRLAPTAEARDVLLRGLEAGLRERSLAGLPSGLVKEVARANGGSLGLQLRVGRPGAVEAAVRLIANEKGDVLERVQVIQTLGELREATSVDALLCASTSAREPVRVAALAALRVFDREDIGASAVRQVATESGPTRTAALTLLTSRAGWGRQLVDAASRGEVDPESVSLDMVNQLRRLKDSVLVERVNRLWTGGRSSTEEDKSREMVRIQALLRKGTGDPYNGKKLFTAACGNCHTLFHSGGAIGPDLTPFRRDDLESLLLSIVRPSAEIREGYENSLLETKDDRSLSGFIVRQDDRVVVLRGLDGQDVVVERGEITELRAAGLSLMPEGLLEGMEDQHVRDLLAYLRSSQPLAN